MILAVLLLVVILCELASAQREIDDEHRHVTQSRKHRKMSGRRRFGGSRGKANKMSPRYVLQSYKCPFYIKLCINFYHK